MKLRHLITDTLGLMCLLTICLLPLGFYYDESGFGWWCSGVGGYHIELETIDNQ